MYDKEVVFLPIVKYKNQSGVTYAYEQTSVYDAEKKQSRPVRKYLGRVDPDTGEIISTKGRRGRPPKQQGGSDGEAGSGDYKALYQEKCSELDKAQKALARANAKIEQLNARVIELKAICSSIRDKITSIKDL